MRFDFGKVRSANGARIILDMRGDSAVKDRGTIPESQIDVVKATIVIYTGGILRKSNAGNRCNIGLRPRENGTIAIADISQIIGDSDEELIVSLHFPASHLVDYIGIDTSAQLDFEDKDCEFKYAFHNTRGDLMESLQAVDSNYAEILPGEFIDLAFTCPSFSGNLKRDLIFVANGYYNRVESGNSNQLKATRIPIVSDLGCYPNPFNPFVQIMFDLNEPAYVKLEIFNILGQKVATLVDEHQDAGSYTVTWDSRGSDGTRVSSGIYLYRLTAGEFVENKKMSLMK